MKLFGKIFTPTHANNVDAYVPEWWANETLAILYDELLMAPLVHRDFEEQIATAGDVVNTRRPNKFVAVRKHVDDDVTVQDANATNIPVPLNQHWHVSFVIKDRQQSTSMKDLVAEYLEPAVKAVAEEIDKMLLGQMVRYHRQSGGQLGVDMTNLDAILELRRKQNELLVPTQGRWLVVSPIIDEQLLKIDTFHEAHKLDDGGMALREALIGRKLGYNFLLSNLISQVSGGGFITTVDGSIDLVAGYPKGTTGSMVVDFTGLGIVTQGQWLTIAGSARPYRVLSQSDDLTNTTGIVLDRPLEDDVIDNAVVSVVSVGAVDEVADYAVNWEKAIHVDGFATAPQVGQFVSFGASATVTAYTILQVVNTAGSDYDITLDRPLEVGLVDDEVVNIGPAGNYGFAFVRNAIALVSRPLALTGQGLGPQTAVAALDGIGVRVTIAYEPRSQGILVTVDLLCGVAELYSELGAVLLA